MGIGGYNQQNMNSVAVWFYIYTQAQNSEISGSCVSEIRAVQTDHNRLYYIVQTINEWRKLKRSDVLLCNTQKKTFFVSMIIKLKKNTLNGTISFMFSQQSSAVIK